MQCDERVHRYPAGADLHARARNRIEHPRRYNRDDAGLRFDLHEPPRATLLTAAEANATPEEGMPAIMDHDVLPEMGRMTRRWLSAGRAAVMQVCNAAGERAFAAPRSSPDLSRSIVPFAGRS